MDIEDLHLYGKNNRVCPFFLARDADYQKTADIILVPYNYLMNPTSRQAIRVNWENVVLIFDEAHNLESSFDDAASISLSGGDIAQCKFHLLLQLLLFEMNIANSSS